MEKNKDVKNNVIVDRFRVEVCFFPNWNISNENPELKTVKILSALPVGLQTMKTLYWGVTENAENTLGETMSDLLGKLQQGDRDA